MSQDTNEPAVTHKSGSDIRPCAVGKVDLKGRLVFVDAEVEALLGFTQDELFGRPLKEFVSEEYYDILDRLLVLHSHFETFFETTQLELINRDDSKIPVAVIVSLNFVAGNPVNFQVIFNPIETAEPNTRQRAANDAWEKTTRLMAESEALWDWKAHVSTIREIANCDEVVVYRVERDTRLMLEATSADPGGGEDPLTLVGEPSDLHKWIARNRMEYSFVDNADIQSAMSIIRTPPNEFCSVVSDRKDHMFLIRVCYGEVDSIQAVRNGIDRIRMVLHALQRSAQGRQQRSDTDLTSESPAVDPGHLLNKVGSGYCLVGPDGTVSAVNDTMTSRVGRPSHVNALLEKLVSETHHYQLEPLTRAINNHEELTLPVMLANGQAGQLQVTKTGEHVQALILTPHGFPRPAGCTAYLVDELQKQIASSVNLANSVESTKNNSSESALSCLDSSLCRIRDLLTLLSESSLLADPAEGPTRTDLARLLKSIHERITAEFPDRSLDLVFDDMAKVKVIKSALTSLMYHLVRLLVSKIDDRKVTISVDSSIIDNKIVITFDTRKSDEPHQLVRLLKAIQTGSGEKPDHVPDVDSATIALLADRLGAELQIEDTSGDAISVDLVIPLL